MGHYFFCIPQTICKWNSKPLACNRNYHHRNPYSIIKHFQSNRYPSDTRLISIVIYTLFHLHMWSTCLCAVSQKTHHERVLPVIRTFRVLASYAREHSRNPSMQLERASLWPLWCIIWCTRASWSSSARLG